MSKGRKGSRLDPFALTDTNAKNLTPEEKQARKNMVATIIAGITDQAGGNAAIATAAAEIEMENNSIRTKIQKILGDALIIGGVPLDDVGIGEVMQGGGTALNREATVEEMLEGQMAESGKTEGTADPAAEEADTLGKAWVGKDYRVSSDGKALVSSDGLRTYRPPSDKRSPYANTGIQANFQRLEIVNGRLKVISNGHLDIAQ